MTPKEKAIELIDIFRNETEGIAAYNYDNVSIDCAKRCVEQILSLRLLNSSAQYWQKVIIEIDKLTTK